MNFSASSAIASSSTTSAGTFAKFRSRSHDAVIRVYDAAGNVIETHEHTGEGDCRYCPLGAGLSPSLIASASLTYLPFFVVP